jgi:sugar phosphate isomerase/epimerase
VTWHLGPVPLAERIRWVADSPLTAVGLMDRMFVSEAQDAVTREVVELIGRLDLDVTIHPAAVPFSGAGGAGGNEREEVFKKAVERAADLQRETGRVRVIAVDPAATSRGGDMIYDPEGTKRSLEFIARAVDGLNVKVGVENWKINPDPEEFRRLRRELASVTDLGLLLDLGHLHVMTDDPVAAARDLPIPVCEVHVHDNSGDSDDHMPLGRGNLPLEGLVEAIRAGGFDGIWTLEIRPTYRVQDSTIRNPRARKAILRSAERLRAAVEKADAAAGQAARQAAARPPTPHSPGSS